jgi:hypothetical protein
VVSIGKPLHSEGPSDSPLALVLQVGMNDAPDKLNSASRNGWEVVTAQFIPSGDAVGRIGIFALLKRALPG